MGVKNKIEEGFAYFLTLTVVDWVDVFTRQSFKQTIVDSLKYCQQEKDLAICAWVIMSNHIHLIAYTKNDTHLSDVLRDFKKYTSKEILKQIQTEPESRKEWMLNRFEFAGRNDSKITNYKFWQEGNEAKQIYTDEYFFQKLNYIHENPVAAGIVLLPQHYLYSSARDYCGEKGLIDISYYQD